MDAQVGIEEWGNEVMMGMNNGLEGFSGYESIRERGGYREGLKKNRRGMTWCLVG